MTDENRKKALLQKVLKALLMMRESFLRMSKTILHSMSEIGFMIIAFSQMLSQICLQAMRSKKRKLEDSVEKVRPIVPKMQQG